MINEEIIRLVLKDVYDPELGINIIDLGLVYDIKVDGGKVYIKMTLTTPGCPIGPMLMADIKNSLSQYDDFESVDIEFVWSPPWTPDMMSDEAKDIMSYFHF